MIACRGPEFLGTGGGGTGPGTGGATSTGGQSTTGGGGVGGMGTGGGDTVSVAVTLSRDDGIEIDGAPVLASDAAGNAIGTLGTTGVNGTATIDVPIGGRVTVFYEDTSNDYAYSAEVTADTKTIKWLHRKELPVTAAVPDLLMRVSCPTCPTSGQVAFSLPCGSEVGQKQSGNDTVSVAFSSYSPCRGLTTLTAYAVAYDLSGAVIAKSSKTGIGLTTDDVLLDPMSTAVTPVPFNIAVSHLPTNPSQLTQLHAHDAAGVSFSFEPTGVPPFSYLESSFVPNLSVQTAILGDVYPILFARDFPLFAGAAITFSASIAGSSAPGAFDGKHIVYKVGGGEVGDAISIRLLSADLVWTLLSAPATTGTITIPTLPGSLVEWKVPATATVGTDNVDSLGAENYAELLAHGVAEYPGDTKDTAGVRWSTDTL